MIPKAKEYPIISLSNHMMSHMVLLISMFLALILLTFRSLEFLILSKMEIDKNLTIAKKKTEGIFKATAIIKSWTFSRKVQKKRNF